MPSAKFTESEVLEPSESFCEREKISEVEADLRAYFAWEIGKPLPGWIYDKLDMFPHLRRHACGFLSFLRTTTSSFNEQERSLYDIMIDCMITDLLMSALQRFETQYRLNEYNARPTLQVTIRCIPHGTSMLFLRSMSCSLPFSITTTIPLNSFKRTYVKPELLSPAASNSWYAQD